MKNVCFQENKIKEFSKIPSCNQYKITFSKKTKVQSPNATLAKIMFQCTASAVVQCAHIGKLLNSII